MRVRGRTHASHHRAPSPPPSPGGRGSSTYGSAWYLKFLHEQRHILFHGHEPLDTDSTPTLEGEAWLLQNGYT